LGNHHIVRFWHKADIPTVFLDVAFGGKADMSRSGLVVCEAIPETHFSGHKSLL